MPLPIPDADGLTTLHRRLIESLRTLSESSDRDFVKTDRVLNAAREGDSRHGFEDYFAALLRIVRPWVCRYPLLETHGNFGSIDGDPSASPRFTEVGFFEDGDVDIPGLLCNGAWAHSGAWAPYPPEEDGYRRYNESPQGGELQAFFPPHNLAEVTRALTLLLDRPNSTLEEVLRVLPGPDFPTGGRIMNPEDLLKLYATGKGRIRIRGRLHVESLPKNRFCVVISEIPFDLDKTRIIEHIAGAFKEGSLTDITDVKDLSAKAGMRIEVEVKAGKDPAWVLHQLQEDPRLESEVSVKMIVRRDEKETRVTLLDLLRLSLEQLASEPRRTLAEWALRSDLRRTSIP